MASGIFALANIGSVRLYVGEAHHLKTRWPQIMARLEQGQFADQTVQAAWQRSAGERRFTFHTAQDIKQDESIRGRKLFLRDCAAIKAK